MAIADDGAHTDQHLFSNCVRRTPLLRLWMETCNEDGGPEDRSCRREEHGPWARHREQDPADRGAAENTETLDRARDHIRCGQLFWSSRQGRSQRGLSRTERARGDR